jgi:hypothetical protein
MTAAVMALETPAQPRRLRFLSGDFHSLMCRLPDCLRKILPVAVILKRRAAALLVFILGIMRSDVLCIPTFQSDAFECARKSIREACMDVLLPSLVRIRRKDHDNTFAF